MKIYAIELDNCEASEDRIVGIMDTAYKSYRDASIQLTKSGYSVFAVDNSYYEGETDYELIFEIQYDNEVEQARILELNLVESV